LAACDAAVFAAERQGTLLDTRLDRAVLTAVHRGLLRAAQAPFLTSAGSHVGENDRVRLVEREADVEEIAANSTASGWTISGRLGWQAAIRPDGGENRTCGFCDVEPRSLGSDEMILDVRNASEFSRTPAWRGKHHTRLSRLDELPRDKGFTFLWFGQACGARRLSSAWASTFFTWMVFARTGNELLGAVIATEPQAK
jgi:hypothetical protein